MARRGRRRASLHSTSKSVENELLREARNLADDPSPIIPQCVGRCPLFCPARKARNRIRHIHGLRDNEAKLQKLARRERNPLARAYAATLLVATSEKLPVVAELRTPDGSVPYVLRGKALPLPLAGIQHASDPALRILAVQPFVKKRAFHFYALPDRLVCTHKTPAPPEEFVRRQLEALDLQEREPGRWTCAQGGTDADEDVLVLDWKPAETRVEIAEPEASGDRNTLHRILRRVATPAARREFHVRVRYAPLERAAGDAPEPVPEATPPGADAYQQGRLTDRDLLQAARTHRDALLRDRVAPLFVIGTKSYGADLDAFIQALEPPTKEEQRALHAALRDAPVPIVLEKASVARALQPVWADRGLQALEAAAGDPDVAHDVYREDAGVDEIPDLIQKAAHRGGEARVQAELPTYQPLPGPARIADAIARQYRTRGRPDAARLALQKAREGRDRAVALAFLQALGESSSQDWRFQASEKELADSLEPHAQALLQGPADTYHEHLETLNRRAGNLQPLEQA